MYGGGAAPGAADPEGGAAPGAADPEGGAPLGAVDPAEPAGRGGRPAFPDTPADAAAEPAGAVWDWAWPARSANTNDAKKPSKTPPQANEPAMVGPFRDGMLAPFPVSGSATT